MFNYVQGTVISDFSECVYVAFSNKFASELASNFPFAILSDVGI